MLSNIILLTASHITIREYSIQVNCYVNRNVLELTFFKNICLHSQICTPILPKVSSNKINNVKDLKRKLLTWHCIINALNLSRGSYFYEKDNRKRCQASPQQGGSSSILIGMHQDNKRTLVEQKCGLLLSPLSILYKGRGNQQTSRVQCHSETF